MVAVLISPFGYFNPLAPRGARPGRRRRHAAGPAFQSTRPSRGETRAGCSGGALNSISIHSPLAGRDFDRPANCFKRHNFNPLAPRGARRMAKYKPMRIYRISIHSPLAGRDQGVSVIPRPTPYFNPLAPRGARRRRAGGPWPRSDFNPLAPRGARRRQDHLRQRRERISIHSPLAGRDCPPWRRRSACSSYFNPLAPRGARRGCRAPGRSRIDFNPLAPRGARRRPPCSTNRKHIFQSTRPSRGETIGTAWPSVVASLFQSTRPSRGETASPASASARPLYFNPLAPRGARRCDVVTVISE